jgi:hypothetical protein
MHIKMPTHLNTPRVSGWHHKLLTKRKRRESKISFFVLSVARHLLEGKDFMARQVSDGKAETLFFY